MNWNFKENAPIYLQIISGLQKAIVNGKYPPGAKLPSVRDLALEAGVNPNTMQRALSELERDGLVYSVRTSGRFVTEEEAVLKNLRKQLGEEIVAEFFSSLHALGMTDEDILAVVTDWVSRNTGAGSTETQDTDTQDTDTDGTGNTTISGGTQ